jgi:CubicO group peptidase (beta-lactamase class C family)
MKTKYSVIFFQIFFFLFLTPVYSQWERSTEIREIQSHDRLQKEHTALLLNSTSIDSFITATMSEYHIPGLSACILKEGELVWHNAYGYADIERNIPVTDSTLFTLASITKTITGTALMQLYERSFFNLDDNVNNYLPPDLQVVNPSYPNDPITFKMILSHVSSINQNWDVLRPLIVAGDSPMTLFDFLKSYLVPGGDYYTDMNYSPYPPAITFNYCGTAIALLGYIVEAITDTAFADYCQKHIFTPLSMNETSWFLANLDTSHIARPYTWSSSGYKPSPHHTVPYYPAGSLRTSSLQLTRFLNAFIQKGTLGDVKILDSATVELMTTIHYPEIPIPGYPDSSQGLIWYQEYFGDRLVWGHSGGSTFGATTAMYYYEPEKTGVIVLSNMYTWPGIKKIVSGLFDYAVMIPTEIARCDEYVSEIFALRQNYPNPFNPATTIEFALPKSIFVTLKIYNLLGEEVATLIAEQRSAGIHRLNWDARGLASGVYLYRLEAGDPSTSSGQVFVQVKKLLLIN